MSQTEHRPGEILHPDELKGRGKHACQLCSGRGWFWKLDMEAWKAKEIRREYRSVCPCVGKETAE